MTQRPVTRTVPPAAPARPATTPTPSRPLLNGGQDFTKGLEVSEVSASQFADLFPDTQPADKP